jgi:hypothetical protein
MRNWIDRTFINLNYNYSPVIYSYNPLTIVQANSSEISSLCLLTVPAVSSTYVLPVGDFSQLTKLPN